MFVDQVLSRGIRLVCCPGNHDLRWKGMVKLAPADGSARDRFRNLVVTRIAPQSCVEATNDMDLVARIGQDVIVSLRSVHRGPKRIKKEQIAWASNQIARLRRAHGRLRLHLLMHHSLWKLPGDKHGDLGKRKRLEDGLLVRHGFQTLINGHNHRVDHGWRSTPKRNYRIHHIQAPTLSDRTPRHTAGFVCWDPASPESTVLVAVDR